MPSIIPDTPGVARSRDGHTWAMVSMTGRIGRHRTAAAVRARWKSRASMTIRKPSSHEISWVSSSHSSSKNTNTMRLASRTKLFPCIPRGSARERSRTIYRICIDSLEVFLLSTLTSRTRISRYQVLAGSAAARRLHGGLSGFNPLQDEAGRRHLDCTRCCTSL